AVDDESTRRGLQVYRVVAGAGVQINGLEGERGHRKGVGTRAAVDCDWRVRVGLLVTDGGGGEARDRAPHRGVRGREVIEGRRPRCRVGRIVDVDCGETGWVRDVERAQYSLDAAAISHVDCGQAVADQRGGDARGQHVDRGIGAGVDRDAAGVGELVADGSRG